MLLRMYWEMRHLQGRGLKGTHSFQTFLNRTTIKQSRANARLIAMTAFDERAVSVCFCFNNDCGCDGVETVLRSSAAAETHRRTVAQGAPLQRDQVIMPLISCALDRHRVLQHEQNEGQALMCGLCRQ
jgi:hypothetical protein